MGVLAQLRANGFDEAYHIPFTKSFKVRCSQCQACSVNGVACHESGCPNQTYECQGCNATVPYRHSYCEDCQ